MTRFEVSENESFEYSAKLVDQAGAPIPAGNLTALTLTLYDYEQKDLTIINGRTKQNGLNANGVTVDAGGVLRWAGLPADTPVLHPTRYTERHRALFEFTHTGGQGAHVVELIVANVSRRP